MSRHYKERNPPHLREVYRFLKGHFGRKPGMVWGAYLFILLAGLSSISTPVVWGWLVDAAANTSSRSFETIMPPILGVVIFSVIHHIGVRGAHFFNCYTDSRVHAEIAAEAVRHVHSFETEWHTNIFAGSIVTAIKRGRSAAHRIFDTICYDFWPAVIVVAGNIIIAWQKSPLIAGSLVIYAISFTAFSIILSLKYVAPKNRVYADEDSRLGGAVADSVTGYAAVKASGAEAHEYQRIQKAAKRFQNAARTAWISHNIIALSQNIIINIGRFVALYLAAIYWVKGTFTPGDVVFVMMNQRVLADYLDGIGNRLRDVIESINDLEEVVTWKNRKPLISGTGRVGMADLSRFALRFENVTFKYSGQAKHAVADFSLDVQPGEKVALVGKTGSGKSTLFRLLHRYYRPQEGRIAIDGHDIADADLPSLRRQLALVSQEPVLFHRSLAENIAYSNPDASLEDIRRAAEMAQIGDMIDTLPHGYETLVGERGIKLSGGERQRVAIARALLADARIILLDEATSALDNETERLVQKALEELTRGRSVLAIAHRISTVQNYDRIVVMDHGRIVETGTHSELLAHGGHYARLYHRHTDKFLPE